MSFKRVLILFVYVFCGPLWAEEAFNNQDAINWRRDKLAEIKKRQDEYSKILDDHKREVKGVTPQSSRPEIMRATNSWMAALEKMKALDQKNYSFLESSNFEALHRFKDNASCAPGINELKQAMEVQKQEGNPSKGELLATASGVYATCSAPPKFGELKDVLEKLQKMKLPAPQQPASVE